MAQHSDIAWDRNKIGAASGLGLLGAGLGLLAALALSGCGIGTDPGLSPGPDGGEPPDRDGGTATPDATPWSNVPEGIPPIDQMTYEHTATATFALG